MSKTIWMNADKTTPFYILIFSFLNAILIFDKATSRNAYFRVVKVQIWDLKIAIKDAFNFL